MIWMHNLAKREVNPIKLSRKFCVYCKSRLEQVSVPKAKKNRYQRDTVHLCKICGWWWFDREVHWGGTLWTYHGTHATLKELDINNINSPIEEVRRYLIAKYDSRFSMNWWLLEDTVASVFKDFGYIAEITARQNDGGIDVILKGNNGDTIGVQVKRYQRSIEVSQIREFVGALLLGGYTKGIFVTTSRYRKGAFEEAERAYSVGVPVKLIDASRFYNALKLTQRKSEISPEEWENIVAKAKLEKYDACNSMGSMWDREAHVRQFYRYKKKLPDFLLGKVKNSINTINYKGFIGKYYYDEEINLYYGTSCSKKYETIPFWFEVEQEAEEAFKEKIDDHLRISNISK